METQKQAAVSQDEFLRLGIQYYVVGRFAALEGLMPTAGVLLHHALEMVLKGILCRWLDYGELEAKKHNLPKLWRAYKAKGGAPTTDKLETTIEALHRFEKIRYPDRYLLPGAAVSLKIQAADLTPLPHGNSQEHSYELVLEDVDEAVKYLFRSIGANCEYYTRPLSESAAHYLAKKNQHPLHSIEPSDTKT